MTDVALSAAAAERIKSVVAREPLGAGLRVAVEGGGCSGFQYKFDIAREKAADDTLVTREGARVVIDETSGQFLNGAEIDYVDDLIGASFRVNNPNASASCGCGTSFSV